MHDLEDRFLIDALAGALIDFIHAQAASIPRVAEKSSHKWFVHPTLAFPLDGGRDSCATDSVGRLIDAHQIFNASSDGQDESQSDSCGKHSDMKRR